MKSKSLVWALVVLVLVVSIVVMVAFRGFLGAGCKKDVARDVLVDYKTFVYVVLNVTVLGLGLNILLKGIAWIYEKYKRKKPDNFMELILSDNVNCIGESAFLGCSNLKSVIIPNGMKTIMSSAFEDCNNLKDVVIPEGVVRIGYRAFRGCKSLEKIEIPSSVICIEKEAFRDCTGLTSMTFTDAKGWHRNGIEINVCDPEVNARIVRLGIAWANAYLQK